MGAISLRGRAHAPDPDLAAILADPNGYAIKDPLALVAKTAVSLGAGKIDRGSPISGGRVDGHQSADLGSVRDPGASSAGLDGEVVPPFWLWLRKHKVLSAIVVADVVAIALWWA
jgi:hypothetical protein